MWINNRLRALADYIRELEHLKTTQFYWQHFDSVWWIDMAIWSAKNRMTELGLNRRDFNETNFV